jgi:hypothetical protein
MLFCAVHGPMGRLKDFAKAAASDDALGPAIAEFGRFLMESGEAKESDD